MIKIDRLRRLSIAVLVIAAIPLFSGGGYDARLALFSGTLILLGTALETVRLELRDLRKDLCKKEQ